MIERKKKTSLQVIVEIFEEGPRGGGGGGGYNGRRKLYVCTQGPDRFYFASVEDFWRSLKRVVGSWLRLYARWRSSAAGFFSFMNDEHPSFSVWVSSDKRGECGEFGRVSG